MIALLDIVHQLEMNLLKRDEELALPYTMDVGHGMIGGKSIRVTSNSQWTESCSLLLINLKWMLSYASAQPLSLDE